MGRVDVLLRRIRCVVSGVGMIADVCLMMVVASAVVDADECLCGCCGAALGYLPCSTSFPVFGDQRFTR